MFSLSREKERKTSLSIVLKIEQRAGQAVAWRGRAFLGLSPALAGLVWRKGGWQLRGRSRRSVGRASVCGHVKRGVGSCQCGKMGRRRTVSQLRTGREVRAAAGRRATPEMARGHVTPERGAVASRHNVEKGTWVFRLCCSREVESVTPKDCEALSALRPCRPELSCGRSVQ